MTHTLDFDDVFGFVPDRWSLHVHFASEATQRSMDPELHIPEQQAFLLAVVEQLAAPGLDVLSDAEQRIDRVYCVHVDGHAEVSSGSYDLIARIADWAIIHLLLRELRLVCNDEEEK